MLRSREKKIEGRVGCEHIVAVDEHEGFACSMHSSELWLDQLPAVALEPEQNRFPTSRNFLVVTAEWSYSPPEAS